MEKTVLYLKPEARIFLKEDSEREGRTMSAQLNKLLELCCKYGGYHSVEKLLDASGQQPSNQGPVFQPAAPEQAPTAVSPKRVGRPRKKPGIIKIGRQTISSNYLFVINKRTDEHLIVFAHDYATAAHYIKDALEAGTFEREDVQSDFNDCDSFTIQPAGGDSIEQVKQIHADRVFYDGWLDLSHIKNANESNADTAKKTRKPRVKPITIKTFMEVRWDEVEVSMVKQFYNNFTHLPEVQEAVQDYIDLMAQDMQYPDFYKPKNAEDITSKDLLEIMQNLYHKLKNDSATDQKGE